MLKAAAGARAAGWTSLFLSDSSCQGVHQPPQSQTQSKPALADSLHALTDRSAALRLPASCTLGQSQVMGANRVMTLSCC